MGPMMKAYAKNFEFSNGIVNLVTSDIAQSDAVRRSRQGKGPSIAWIVGHVMHYRVLIMRLLGAKLDSPYEKPFGTQGANDGADYPTLAELTQQWNAQHAELSKLIEQVEDDQLLAAAPGKRGPHGERKVLDALSFFVWHEAYHLGALGALRVEFGYPETAELATRAQNA